MGPTLSPGEPNLMLDQNGHHDAEPIRCTITYSDELVGAVLRAEVELVRGILSRRSPKGPHGAFGLGRVSGISVRDESNGV